MKILHASFQRFWAPGIAAQVEAEQWAAEQLGITWTSRLFVAHTEDVRSRVVVGPIGADSSGASRREFYRWLKAELKSQDYDLLILRYVPAAPDQVFFLNQVKIPVFLAHHTLEGPELAAEGGVKSWIKRSVEGLCAFLSLRRCAGIVAVTPEIAQYESRRGLKRRAPVHIYPNGIATTEGQVKEDARAGVVPVLLFVAAHFSPWHGLDRLLSTARASDKSFLVHIAGLVSEPDLRAMVDDARFVAHGMLRADEMSSLIEQSWLGLSSFALDRKFMTQACTLKVREYLASGLPVYAGHDDVFGEAFPFFTNGPCDMDCILEAAERARMSSRLEVAQAARHPIDKRYLLQALHQALTS